MANTRLFNFLSNMRVDVPHLKAVESSVLFDFKTLLQAFVGDTPYIARGFDINNPGSMITQTAGNIQVIVDSAMVWMPAEADGSFLRVDSGTANETLNSANTKVVGSFTASATNYVSVKFTRETDSATNDLVAFWDVDSDVEFNKTVPLGKILKYQFIINTSGFGTNSPIAIVKTDGSGNITEITNAKTSLLRLGKGGSSPNASYNWAYSLPTENPLTLTTSGGPNPYAGGDWELKTFKDWLDAVMTEIKSMKGSAYWYSPGSSSLPGVNLLDTWSDAVGSVITGAGKFQHDNSIPGKLTWTSDLYIRSIIGNLTYTINPSNVTLTDGQVAYITLVRNQDFQPANTFSFTNGSVTVNATATITGISAGDWIKFEAHDLGKWAKVQTVVGSTITLTAAYQGATATGKALRSQGVYTVSVANPDSVPASANTFWIAKRDDNAVPTATIESALNSGATRTSDITTFKTTSPHQMVTGDSIAVSGVSDSTFDGVFDIIDIPTSTTLTVLNPGLDIGSGLVGSGSITVRARIYLRSFGELSQGEERQVDDNAVLNILQFIGSTSETDIYPPYTITPNGLSPYNFSTTNNLTQAISAITGNVNEIFTALDQPVYDETMTVIADPGPYIQAQNLTDNTGVFVLGDNGANDRFAQSFTASSTGNMTDVTVKMRKSAAPDADIVCELWSDSGGQPDTLIAISTNVIAASSLPVSLSTTQTFTFTPEPIVVSTIYWVVFRLDNIILADSSNRVVAAIQNTNPYPSGVFSQSTDGGSTWTPQASMDLYFSIQSASVPGPNELYAPVPAGTTITIPLNSRLIATPQQYYVVGKGTLQTYLNGQMLILDAINGWNESGVPLTNSSEIVIQQDLAIDDQLTFRLGSTGGPASGGSAPDDNFYTLPAEPSASNADYVLIYDTSANAYKKQLRSDFLAGISGNLIVNTYTANQILSNSNQYVRVDAAGGNITITLPLASANIGKVFQIKKVDATANSVIINPATDTIDGSSSLSFNIQYQSYTLIAAASGKWEII